MNDDERDQKVFDLLLSLLNSPAEDWDKRQVDDMRLSVECGEYGVPLENLIALGLTSHQGFDAMQLEALNTLIDLMSLEDSLWVLKLRHYERDKQITSNRDDK